MTKLISFFFLLLPTAFCSASAPFDDFNSFVYAGCSQQSYDLAAVYGSDLESLLNSLSSAASFLSYTNLTMASSSAGRISGLYQCRSDLPLSYCSACVSSAISRISALCHSATGGAMQLRACFLRYGNDTFVGKEDTTLLFNKCGADVSGNNDLNGMRDAALNAIASATPTSPATGGYYRSGGAGYVQAMSQCVGDLNVKQCSDCVTAAVVALKSGCEFSVAGEAYLGKCYARFWCNGAPSSSSGHSFGNGDGSGKTVAIIIGLMAGVALVIIFLYFIKKEGQSGKI